MSAGASISKAQVEPTHANASARVPWVATVEAWRLFTCGRGGDCVESGALGASLVGLYRNLPEILPYPSNCAVISRGCALG